METQNNTYATVVNLWQQIKTKCQLISSEKVAPLSISHNQYPIHNMRITENDRYVHKQSGISAIIYEHTYLYPCTSGED